MNKPRLHLLAAIVALVLAGLACNFGASTANIPNAWTAYDKEGAQPSTVFAQDDVIHLIVELANAPDDTVVKASWTAVEAEGLAPNTALNETETASGDGTLYFELSNNLLWPVGQYKVDVYLNDELDRMLAFEVQGDVSAAPVEPTSSPPASGAVVNDAWTAHDEEGTQPTTVFAPDEIFYLIIDLANAPDDTVVTVAWTAVEVEGETPNTALDQTDLTTGDGILYFNLSNESLWPIGRYSADIFLNNVLDRTLEFDVQGGTPPAAGAVIEDAYLARDDAGAEPTTVFTPNDIFYCLVTLANAPDDTSLKAVWTAVEAQGEAPNTFIDEADITQGDGVITFNLSNTNPWPIGTYKVEIYLNGVLDRTLEFEVQ